MVVYSFLLWNQIGMVLYTIFILFGMRKVYFYHFLYWSSGPGKKVTFLGRDEKPAAEVGASDGLDKNPREKLMEGK